MQAYHVRSYCVGSLVCQILLCGVSTCSAGLFSVGPWCGNVFEGLRAASLFGVTWLRHCDIWVIRQPLSLG